MTLFSHIDQLLATDLGPLRLFYWDCFSSCRSAFYFKSRRGSHFTLQVCVFLVEEGHAPSASLLGHLTVPSTEHRCAKGLPRALSPSRVQEKGKMVPSFVEVLVGQSNGLGIKPTNQEQTRKDSTPNTGSDRVRGLYLVIEGPTKNIQILEMAIKGIKALSDRALVCHFNGYWPKLTDLHSQLDACWKPLLQQTFLIYPCAWGLFVIDFDNQEDRSKIEEVGPWFWGSSSIFMQHWSPTFNPTIASISTIPVWVKLPNLRLHLWNDPSLQEIWNVIGQYHNIYLNTTKFFKMKYARICVQMDLNEGLPTKLKIVNQDYSWTQALDYKNISFGCKSYYNIGNLEKAFLKTSQPFRHRKATWWIGARPEHYTVSNRESAQHDDIVDLQQENTLREIWESIDPQNVEPTRDVLATPLENLGKSIGESTPGPRTTTSPDSEWKLVTKKFSGEATVPQESGGHIGTRQLNFGTLKLPALNKATLYLLEKSVLTKTSRNTWKKTDGEKKEKQ